MKIILSSASHHAMLFVYAAKETIDSAGQEGVEAVVEAVKTYGLQRGRRMAARARKDGSPVNALTYTTYSEWECFPGQIERRTVKEGGKLHILYTRCPWYTLWNAAGLLEYGKYYCDYVDEAMMKGFGLKSGRLEHSRADGYECCDIVFPGGRYTREMFANAEAARAAVSGDVKMPWEYHIGHLYHCLRESITKRLGKKGQKCLDRALVSYEKEFGPDALALVLAHADDEFEAAEGC